MMSQKLLALLSADPVHKEWANAFTTQANSLKLWEYQHLGRPTFSKAFEMLALQLNVWFGDKDTILKLNPKSPVKKLKKIVSKEFDIFRENYHKRSESLYSNSSTLGKQLLQSMKWETDKRKKQSRDSSSERSLTKNFL
jgi:hypothetical protein